QRMVIVAANDLVEGANPEQRLTFTPRVPNGSKQRRRPLEQPSFLRVLATFGNEPGMGYSPTGKGEIRLNAVQFPIRLLQRLGGTPKHRLLVQPPRPLDPGCLSHQAPGPSLV